MSCSKQRDLLSPAPHLRRPVRLGGRARVGERRLMPPVPQGSLSAAITSEGGLIEGPGLELLEELGWQHANLMQEQPRPANPTGGSPSASWCCRRACARRSSSSTRRCPSRRCSKPSWPSRQTVRQCCRSTRTAMSIGCCVKACLSAFGSRMGRSSPIVSC